VAEEFELKFRPKVVLVVIVVGCIVGAITRHALVGNRTLDDYLSTIYGLLALIAVICGVGMSIFFVQNKTWGLLNISLLILSGGIMWVIPWHV
jgi:hypothetical protein